MKREKYFKVNNDKVFGTINIILLVWFFGTLIFSIIDKCCCILPWPKNYDNVIGVSSQIITAITALVVSVIGISISLQNEEFFGVKISKLYMLRVTKHYSMRQIILAPIFLCVINLVSYMCGLTFAAVAILLESLIFLSQVVYMEIPIMAKEEKAILQILKDNLKDCHINGKEPSADLKEAIKYLLYRKNFKELYEGFKDDFDDEYNQYLVIKLLEFQQYLAFGILDRPVEEQKIIGSSLLTNVMDIIFRNVDLTEKMYEEIEKNMYLLTRVLFRINEIQHMKNSFSARISELVRYITFSNNELKMIGNYVSSVLIILTTETVKNSDFGIIKIIRKQLSQCKWGLRKESPALTVFVVISLQLYYLCCLEKDVPDELKSKIHSFIIESNVIEDNTKISSWKQLYEIAAKDFNVDYDKFLKLVMKHEHNLEYWLYGTGAKFVILGPNYVTHWYLTNLINKKGFSEINFESLSADFDELYLGIKEFGEKCLDEERKFKPTDDMKSIVDFYDDSKEHFLYFKINEERNHNLFNTVNRIKREELKHEVDLVEQIDSIKFTNKIKQGIEDAIKKEWGFNASLEIKGSERYFAMTLEKFSDVINFEETVIDYCIRSVFADIENNVKKTVVYRGDNIDENIQTWLQKQVKYVAKSVKNTVPYFYINDDVIKNTFLARCDTWMEIESELLGDMILVTEEGFEFNCVVKEVDFLELSDEQLANQVEMYKREDGQYVFDGTFLPKEEIIEIIKDKFGILKITICHEVISNVNSILEINPYTTREENNVD